MSWPQACIDADLVAVLVAGPHLAGVGQPGLLGDRQGVHVGADQDDRAGAVLQDADDRRCRRCPWSPQIQSCEALRPAGRLFPFPGRRSPGANGFVCRVHSRLGSSASILGRMAAERASSFGSATDALAQLNEHQKPMARSVLGKLHFAKGPILRLLPHGQPPGGEKSAENPHPVQSLPVLLKLPACRPDDMRKTEFFPDRNCGSYVYLVEGNRNSFSCGGV